MPYQLEPRQLDIAFQQGELNTEGGVVRFSTHALGELHLTSGRLAACDPFIQLAPEPFSLALPPGHYPVELAVAHFPNGDERSAFARLRLGTGAAQRWQMALLAGQSAATLEVDQYFGYQADMGAGGFMDATLGTELTADEAANPDLFERFTQAMAEHFRPSRGWMEYTPPRDDGVTEGPNLIAFTSGWGGGTYPTFFGLSRRGAVVAVVTDFMLIPTEAWGLPPCGERPWWRLW